MSKRSAGKNRAKASRQGPQDGAGGPFTSKTAPSERRNPQKASQDLAGADERGGKGAKSLALWLSAAILIVSGYSFLHKVDPAGQNFWAILSPALLLCGYLLIIPAIAYTYPKK